jgi:flagellar basal-body rod protein FlgB
MSDLLSLFNQSDRLQVASLNQRLQRNNVITGNIANSETPGFRALGYDFEKQLSEFAGNSDDLPMKATNPKHMLGSHAQADGSLNPDVFVRPSESVSHDGNTVDVDKEMANLAQNQILYRTAVELINRKVGTLRYAISGGTR